MSDNVFQYYIKDKDLEELNNELDDNELEWYDDDDEIKELDFTR